MLPAKDFLANLQSLFEQRFGFGIVAHILIKQRQIVQACGRIGMLPAKDFLANLQSLFEQRFGFGIVAHLLDKATPDCSGLWPYRDAPGQGLSGESPEPL